jgi:hypothetical protein
MRRLLFIAVGIFPLFSAFSMNLPCCQKLDEYIKNYQEGEPVDSAVFKKALLEEIESDEYAIQEYGLFGQDKYEELLEHWLKHHLEMLPENAQRFKELLIWITIIIALRDDSFDKWEDWKNPWKEQILHVVGDRSNVTKEQLRYVHFCYNLAFSRLIDIGMAGKCWLACQLCEGIAPYLNGTQHITTDNIVGTGGWDGYAKPIDVWLNLRVH